MQLSSRKSNMLKNENKTLVNHRLISRQYSKQKYIYIIFKFTVVARGRKWVKSLNISNGNRFFENGYLSDSTVPMWRTLSASSSITIFSFAVCFFNTPSTNMQVPVGSSLLGETSDESTTT